MSFTTFKSDVNTEITSKHLVPNSVNALIVGDKFSDLADEVIAAFSILNGGTLPTDQDTILKIANKIIAINTQLGSSGKTIDQIITDLNARDTSTVVDTKISTALNNLIGSAPGLLNTLDELAQALGDDPNFAATITTALAGKEPSFNKNTAFNKNFGTTAGTVSEGNHTHNTDSLTEGTTKKFFSEVLTRATLLTGLVTGSALALEATDSILLAFGKIRKFMADNVTAMTNKANLAAGTVPLTEMNARVVVKDAVTGKIIKEDLPDFELMDRMDTEVFRAIGSDPLTSLLSLKGNFLQVALQEGYGAIIPTFAASAPQHFGIITPTYTGLAARNLDYTTWWGQQSRHAHVSTAVAGTGGNIRVGATIFAMTLGFYAKGSFCPGAVAEVATPNKGFFMGLIGTASGLSASLTLDNYNQANIAIGWGFGDTTLSIYTNDASSSTPNKIALGANYPIDTILTDAYEWELWTIAGSRVLNYKVIRRNATTGAIVNQVSGTTSTKLPLDSRTLAYHSYLTNNTDANVATVETGYVSLLRKLA